MIPLYILAAILQKDEEEMLSWLRQHKVLASKVDNNWLVDETNFYRALRRLLKLKECDEYLEEVETQRKDIERLRLELDGLAYLYESVKSISPTLQVLINEMATLLPNKQKRSIFIDLSLGTSIVKVAEKNNLSVQQTRCLYKVAVDSVNRKIGVIKDRRNSIAYKKMEIRRLEIINRNQQGIIANLTDALRCKKLTNLPDYKTPEEIMPLSIVEKLSLRLIEFDFGGYCHSGLAYLDMDTLEDLLRYVKKHGFKRLLKTRSIGEISLKKMKEKLREAGIIDENDQSYLFDFLN